MKFPLFLCVFYIADNQTKNMNKMRKIIISLGLITISIIQIFSQEDIKISESLRIVTIENSLISIQYSLLNGTYQVRNKKTTKICISNAAFVINNYNQTMCLTSKDTSYKPIWNTSDISDEIGKGKMLQIKSYKKGYPGLIFQISLYNGKEFFVLNGGIDNNTSYFMQVRDIQFIGNAFKNFKLNDNYQTLDGNGDRETTVVSEKKNSWVKNNLLVKFGKGNELNSFVLGGISYHDFKKEVWVQNQDTALYFNLFCLDSFGRRVDPGTQYIPDDKFYISFITANPFDALEQYASTFKKAQKIHLPMYDFLTQCMWYACHKKYGGGPVFNDSPNAVWEMEQIKKRGFLNYSRAVLRFEPDCYGINNQQGWWDDEHFQMYGDNEYLSVGPHYKAPYETTEKWCKGVMNNGGIPFFYIQPARRSEDFCTKYPNFMLFNNPYIKKNNFTSFYDYTDSAFIHYMTTVYLRLKKAGIKGIMFDYPNEGWSNEGGFEDKYKTSSWAYRNMFKIPHEVLGEDSYLQENISIGSDLVFGLVASQRIWSDNDMMTPEMVSRAGLRWYKNRVVINYDMDSKNPNRAVPSNRDGVRAVYTMSYIVTGHYVSGLCFSRYSDEQLKDLTRIFPFHTQHKSARPLDAFTSKSYPQIYDFEITPDWHQLTFYNTKSDTLISTVSKKKIESPIGSTISIELGKSTAEGGLGLDANQQYYIFDFWNDQLVGKFTGNELFSQNLRPGEARMMSVHKVENNPQFISTNRHIMQGYVDMIKRPVWDNVKKQLSGVSKVVGGETYVIVVATNGYKYKRSVTTNVKTTTQIDEKTGLLKLLIESAVNADVEWRLEF